MLLGEICVPFPAVTLHSNALIYYMIINNISKGVDWQFFRIFLDFFRGTAKFWRVMDIKT